MRTDVTDWPRKFRYLNDPSACWRNEEAASCVVCDQRRPGYWFVHLHDEGCDEYHVCGPCLTSGRLAERGLCVNIGDEERLVVQLRETRPDLPEGKRLSLAAEHTEEVERRTPKPKVFNEFTWPAHCGDYAVFHGQVHSDDLNALAPDGDGRMFLAANMDDDPEGLALDWEAQTGAWEEGLRGFLRFYHWQCRVCGDHVLTFDHE